LINEEYFKAIVIPREAERMSAAFLIDLQCMTNAITASDETFNQDVSGDIMAYEAARRIKCVELFRHCLSLKASMILTGELYEFKWVNGGVAYNGEYMKLDDRSTMSVGHDGQIEAVHMCLFPMLLVHHSDLVGTEMDGVWHFSEALVRCNNFLSSKDLGSFSEGILLSEALVI
jgi:hypothetical protein